MSLLYSYPSALWVIKINSASFRYDALCVLCLKLSNELSSTRTPVINMSFPTNAISFLQCGHQLDACQKMSNSRSIFWNNYSWLDHCKGNSVSNLMFSQLKSKLNHNCSTSFDVCLTEDSGNATNGMKYFCDRLLSTSLFCLNNNLLVIFTQKRLTHFNEMWTLIFFQFHFFLICKCAKEKFCHSQSATGNNEKVLICNTNLFVSISLAAVFKFHRASTKKLNSKD